MPTPPNEEEKHAAFKHKRNNSELVKVCSRCAGYCVSDSDICEVCSDEIEQANLNKNFRFYDHLTDRLTTVNNHSKKN